MRLTRYAPGDYLVTINNTNYTVKLIGRTWTIHRLVYTGYTTCHVYFDIEFKTKKAALEFINTL